MSNSTRTGVHHAGQTGLPLAPRTIAAFLLAVIAVVLIAVLSYTSLQSTAARAQSLARSIETMAQIQTTLSTLKDAETGQRGYLLTDREAYLEPFLGAKSAIPREFASLRALTADNPAQRARLDALQSVANDKMVELDETVALKNAGQSDRALAEVRGDRGKRLMDRLRDMAEEMIASERQLITARTLDWQHAAAVSFGVTWGGSAVLLFLIAAAAYMASRDFRARQLESWLRAGQIGLSELMRGDQPLDELGRRVLGFLADYLAARVGAIFVAEGGQYRRIAGFALPAGGGIEAIRPGDGLAGEAARANRPLRVRDVPAGYLPVSSSVGSATAAELLIAPASIDGTVQAVVELGFFGNTLKAHEALLERVGESIAVAIRASKDRGRLEDLLHETQQQAAELQTREEELRVNNEELEEQGRTLKESRAQLESQQAELEQINTQLEEQAHILQQQKDALAKSHAVLTQKTTDLQRANEYKSEFLANMSHELRTPLNSTLILAKLLADNKEGNLTDNQVRFAQTISSAGNDLLTLINDVLDLSRIEAGKIDLAAESVSLPRTFETLTATFQPAADQKKLTFRAVIEQKTPLEIETDPQRLGQILKNLVSNALKFTERGEVSLRAFVGADGRVCFAVRDTGVGIPADQQEIIFEAFRQADGSIHRKYGGTGLGLSISRDLARLLGGTISVQSEPGEGSTFTLALPLQYVAGGGVGRPVPSARDFAPSAAKGSAAPAAAGATPRPSVPDVGDDRAALLPNARLILVIEDDVSFAAILRDLAREMGFQCVVAHSANDGLSAAAQYRPNAILLDINLPDHSGLGVLDQLKRDARTRHIPVHVASVADYRREALELGAVGYALKPAKREELVDALRLLELKSSQALRRVLIVEDDPRQRESIRQLLSNGDVQIIGVENATEALAQLQASTFDCVVMDFNLPDYSGYDLLEKMAKREDISFPPVIVYTGRALCGEEEQRLRRYSKSIIIKDARSPERLLDEVTLFLHQVESKLPPERQHMLKEVRDREQSFHGRRVLVVEDDVRNIFALSSVLEPKGATVEIARNGLEAIDALARGQRPGGRAIDMVLMDIMMPEMDGLTAMREIRRRPELKKLPIIALTAKAMKDDQDKCLAAGANDYIAKPLDVEKLLSLVRVWMPK
jgi:CheY-like chemotaxis protein